MKIAIGYPPLVNKKGIPLLSQNRQFQWFYHPCFIYPVVPAQAATLLKNSGYEVFWLDGIAEKWTFQRWLLEVKKIKPDLIMMETKTPVIKIHWKIIDQIKKENPRTKIVLVGDHVTALPNESFNKSKVDYILTGGDYDWLLLNLAKHLDKKEKFEPGIYYRNQKKKVLDTGKFILNHDLNKNSFIDRELTKWQLYAYENGNYKRTPGTYIMSGRDCWWRKNGGCKFCAWTVLYTNYRFRKPENVLDEIGQLIEKYQIKEIMDDTGTFPIGEWLEKFCHGMIRRGYHQKIYFNCNLRFGVLKKEDYRLMAKAGFRFLLYGLESANQETLDKLNKGTIVNQVEKELKMIGEVNKEVNGHLEPHVTCMVGYPWENKNQAEKTIEMTKKLFAEGLINTLQATIVIPYPGTNLFKECCQEKWLKTQDWDKYDMSQPIMKNKIGDKQMMSLAQGIYKSFLTPKFIFRKLFSVRKVEDLIFFRRALIAFVGHLIDFKGVMK
jgi:anaerobic magnesium-protoporphyrin IX monomethyl ester cyclase